MRVLFTALSGAEQPTGICRAAVNLVRSLNEAHVSCEVVLVVGTWQQGYFRELLGARALNLELVEVRIANNSVSRNWWYANVLPKFARKCAAAIVHAGFPVPVFRTRFTCPVITTLHDLYPYDRPENFGFPRVLWNRAFLRQSLRNSDRIVCVSRSTHRRLEYYFPILAANKSLHIANAVAARPAASSLPEGVSSPFILTVAQHRANKRLDLLIDCFAEGRATGVLSSGTRLVIVGSQGPETPRIQGAAARRNLSHDVLFLSNVADSQLTALYEECDLYVSLADVEGYGLPIAEALQCGARVLASDIAAHREVGADLCDYIELGSTPELSKVVKAIAAALDRPRSVKAIGTHSASTAERMLRLYHDVLETSAGSGSLQREAAAS